MLILLDNPTWYNLETQHDFERIVLSESAIFDFDIFDHCLPLLCAVSNGAIGDWHGQNRASLAHSWSYKLWQCRDVDWYTKWVFEVQVRRWQCVLNHLILFNIYRHLNEFDANFMTLKNIWWGFDENSDATKRNFGVHASTWQSSQSALNDFFWRKLLTSNQLWNHSIGTNTWVALSWMEGHKVY